MPYLNEAGLAYYDPKLKEWVGDQPVKTLPSTLYPWTQTDKAGAVTCWPVGGTQLLPTVDFMFTEVPPASGDKGPENPSKIEGFNLIHCSLIGEDLLDQSDIEFSTLLETHSESVSEDGWIKLYAKNETSSYKFLAVRHKLKSDIIFDANKTYKIHLEIRSLSATTSPFAGLAVALDIYSNTDLEIHPIYWISSTSVITPAVIELSPSTAASFDTGDYAFTDRIQCNPAGGEMSIEYRVHLVEYVGTNNEKTYLTINLPSTYYGGSIDLSTGVMTVTWERDVCTSFASVDVISTNTISFRYNASAYHPATGVLNNQMACNRFPVINNSDDVEHCRFSGAGNTNTSRFYINKTRLDISGAADPSNPTNAEWVTAANVWLASHPTFLVYILATPYTVPLTPLQIYSLSQLNPYTPRLNTVYSDQVSVQVGYPKSPLATSTELTNAIVSLGGNL